MVGFGSYVGIMGHCCRRKVDDTRICSIWELGYKRGDEKIHAASFGEQVDVCIFSALKL
jgi:hypothetical protein